MSQNQTSTKVLALILIVSALVAGAAAGFTSAAFNSLFLPPPTTTKVTPQTFSSNLWLVTMNDTTSQRAFDTVYLNSQNNGQAMIVQIYANMSDSGAQLIAHVGTSRTAAAKWANTTVATIAAVGASGDNLTMELAFYVPWAFYYCVNATTVPTTVTLVKWFESIPPTGFGQIIAATILNLRRFF
jgi:hypothetical protein